MSRSESSASRLGDSIAVGAGSALALGFLDVTRTLFAKPEGLASWSIVLAAASTTTLFGAVFFAIAWLAVVLPARRMGELTPIAVELAAASFFFALLFLVPAADLPHLGSWPQSIPGLMPAAFLALVVACGVYFLVDAISESRSYRHVPRAAALALPFLLAELCGLVWLGKFRFGSATGLATVALNLVALVVLVATAVPFRRARLSWVLAGLLALFLSSAAGAVLGLRPSRGSAAASVPAAGAFHPVRHVILVTIDTLRADVVSCYGSRAPLTPAIDSLAAHGIRFAEAKSPAPWTVPTIASLLTGLSPSAHGATAFHSMLPDAARTLAEVLRDSGYVTAALGANGLLGPERNVSQGFVRYDFFPRPPLPPSHGVEILRRRFREHFHPVATTARLTELASEWARAHAASDFFLWVHYLDPHTPYTPPVSFQPAGDDASLRIGFKFSEPLLILQGILVPTLHEREWLRRLYEAEVRYVDENIGELIGTLKSLGLYENALIVLTSDHGEEFWEHGKFFHGHSLYEELLRVPLIVKLPGARVRKTVAGPVSLTGVMPTILEVAGIDHDPRKFSERSLARFWEDDGSGEAADPLISEAPSYFNQQIAVELAGRKYILDLLTGHEELYDLSLDPREMRPIGEVPGAIRDRMKAILVAHEKKSRELRDHYQITAESRDAKVDPAMVEKLKALGYLN